MGDLTITHDGTTGELLAHIAELQRKASAYDKLVEDVTDVWRHLVAYDVSYLRSSLRYPNDPATKSWHEAKAQAFAVAAANVQRIIEQEL